MSLVTFVKSKKYIKESERDFGSSRYLSWSKKIRKTSNTKKKRNHCKKQQIDCTIGLWTGLMLLFGRRSAPADQVFVAFSIRQI